MLSIINKCVKLAQTQLIQKYCTICHLKVESDQPGCELCRNAFRTPGHHCRICANPLPEISTTHPCGKCLNHPPAFDRTLAAFEFNPVLRHMIHQFKYHGKLNMGRVLARNFINNVQLLESSNPQVIIPVPLHDSKIANRGFNQALELAKPIAKHFQIPIDAQFLRRTKNSVSQSGLNAKQRQTNVKNSFSISANTQYQSVILFDDVMTTAATANECAKTLKRYGVKNIDVWVCARVPN